MDETIYRILKFLFDFALEVWFSINNFNDVLTLYMYCLIQSLLYQTGWEHFYFDLL